MSKTMFIFCIIISVGIHGWLLWGDARLEKPKEIKAVAKKLLDVKPVDVEVVAVPKKQPPPPEKKPEPAPEKKPEPQKEPEKKEEPLPLEKKAAKPKTDLKEKGDFAGDTDGQDVPSLRIDWGTSQSAGRILSASKMKLVIFEADKQIKNEIASLGNDEWKLKKLVIDQGMKYSQSIRIVDKVPAFKEILDALNLKPGQHLAIMIPVPLEQQIEAAKNSAAVNNGLSMKQIRAFGGKFQLEGNTVAFEITLVKTKS